jgi:hypothetical protein
MTVSNYDFGFPNGVAIRNLPIEPLLNPIAKVFWVDSINGSDGNSGNFHYPFATINYAVTQCTNGNGDRIFVAAGHIEDVASAGALAINKTGVIIEFLGEGSLRGTINFKTLVTASMTITAANVTLINPRFTAAIDALTGPISITAANCSIINGLYYDGTAIDTTNCIVATTAATGLTISGWRYVVGTGAGTQKNSNIKLTAVANPTLKNIDISGNFLVANINNATTECTGMRLQDVFVANSNATPKPGIVLRANATGMAKNVDVRIASGTTFVSSVAKVNWDAQCLGYNTDGETGTPIAVYTP